MANARVKIEADIKARRIIQEKINAMQIAFERMPKIDKLVITQPVISNTFESIQSLIENLSWQDSSEYLKQIKVLNERIDSVIAVPGVDTFHELLKHLQEILSQLRSKPIENRLPPEDKSAARVSSLITSSSTSSSSESSSSSNNSKHTYQSVDNALIKVTCPVTQEIFFHPVSLIPSGIVLEQAAADTIIASGRAVCPITKKPIEGYMTCYPIMEEVDAYLTVNSTAKSKQHDSYLKTPYKKVEAAARGSVPLSLDRNFTAARREVRFDAPERAVPFASSSSFGASASASSVSSASASQALTFFRAESDMSGLVSWSADDELEVEWSSDEDGIASQRTHQQIERVLERGRTLDELIERHDEHLEALSITFWSRSPQGKKNLHNELLLKINKDSKSVTERNQQFISLDLSFYNYHKNKKWDHFFGLYNTKSWRNTVSSIRESAFKKLIKEVDNIHWYGEKIRLLEDAKKMAIFNTHRNNSIFFGAFWRTAKVKEIDKKIEEYQQKSRMKP